MHSKHTDTHRKNVDTGKLSWDAFAYDEKFSLVWYYFCQGKKATEIEEIIHHDYVVHSTFNRNSILAMIRRLAIKGRLSFNAKPSVFYTDEMNRRFTKLKSRVVFTKRFEDIANLGAETLIATLKRAQWLEREEVHIGFAGGHAMRLLVRTFARLLHETDDPLPETLVLHALVAGFDVTDPTTDPNMFFTLFQDETKFQSKFKFIGLQTPPRVKSSQYRSLRDEDWFKDSHDQACKLDFILTSAANWADEHSTFRKSMERSDTSFMALDQAGCLGDMLWLPIGPQGPLEVNTDIRSMTLLEFSELADFVSRGKEVMLLLGPCAGCSRYKTDVLSGILASPKPLISYLISDTGTIKGIVSSDPKQTVPPNPVIQEVPPQPSKSANSRKKNTGPSSVK
jgi:hypothetical protein